MAPPRYAPVPNPRASPDAEREMDNAFDDDTSEHGENTPLTIYHQPTSHPVDDLREGAAPLALGGVYDFERDYDYPPPGSPPGPSSVALPNNYGNSNGQLPSSPVVRTPRPSIFRRAVGAMLPSYYKRVPTERPRGGGIDNDGVFANVMAKPGRAVPVRMANGDIYMVPEDVQSEAPPSYAAASADAAPAYWETTVHAPSATDLNGDMIVDELPTGSLITFFFTALVSWFFQLPGFILTYLLHGTHAGKFGSQAGLALTLIQYGFSVTVSGDLGGGLDNNGQDNNIGIGALTWSAINAGVGDGSEMPTNSTTGAPSPTSTPIGDQGQLNDLPSMYMGHEWISFLLMTIGWFLLLTSLIGYFRVKRFEISVRASRSRGPSPLSTEDAERDTIIRRNLEQVFGTTVVFDEGDAHTSPPDTASMEPPPSWIPRALDMSHARLEGEARLEADLRAAGLL